MWAIETYTGLLGGTTDTRVTDNTNSETSSKTTDADSKTSSEINESPEGAGNG